MDPQEQLLEDARQALQLDEASPQAEEAYGGIIKKLSNLYGDNQKEIAQALKSVARRLEAADGQTKAFVFKQRACEMLLRHNMELRRSGKTLATQTSLVAPSLTSNLPETIVQKAQQAAHQDVAATEEAIVELIKMLESFHANNQKEVATSLQHLSKQIPSEEEAFQFKQRTCEVMLKLSMAQRRKDRRLQ